MAEGSRDSDSKGRSESSRSSRAGCARSALLSMGALLIVVYVFIRAGDGNGDDTEDRRHNTVTTEPRPTTTLASQGIVAVDPECPEEDGSSDRELKFTEAPPLCIDPDATYVATVATNRGEFEVTLDPASAPLAVNSFVFLARYHFYDGVAFHRVLEDFLAQTGDPFSPDVGDADAGYLLPEEPPTVEPFYPEGAVAMSNLGEPDSTGSEWFVVTGPGAEGVPATYSRIGEVTSGMDVVDAINATAIPNDNIGVPTELTVIDTITIEEN
jgi:cyclophilin family peptidyl-prolyl cis-trans isomerase